MTAAERSPTPYANELHQARLQRRVVAPLRTRAPLTIDDAYQISLAQLALRQAAGERLIGKKIGVTSKPVQDMLGVHEPDFGFLTDAMHVANNSVIRLDQHLIQPRAEAEIALILRANLSGPGVTPSDVLAATESVAPCIEVVDSRIADWDIRIVDTVADNASCGLFVLGVERLDPRKLDLPAVKCRMLKNGRQVSAGVGAAVQGSPLVSTAWLANTLGRYGVSLVAGDIILSGSMVPLEPVAAGDNVLMELEGLGSASIAFA